MVGRELHRPSLIQPLSASLDPSTEADVWPESLRCKRSRSPGEEMLSLERILGQAACVQTSSDTLGSQRTVLALPKTLRYNTTLFRTRRYVLPSLQIAVTSVAFTKVRLMVREPKFIRVPRR